MERNGNEMISFGAGVNSVAMTIMLVNEGWRGPVVFADTGGEWPETYCYLEYFQREFLEPRGLEVVRILPGSRWHKRSKLSLEAFCLDCGIIPFLASRWCSVEWKQTPLRGWAADNGVGIYIQGISASEPQRIRDNPNFHYPLVENGITRGGCKRIIRQAGLEVPIKSGCFFCPGQNLGGWRRLYYDHPGLYERAVALEENASRRKEGISLDPHGISLRQHVKRRWQGQMQMDLSQWLPCVCHL